MTQLFRMTELREQKRETTGPAMFPMKVEQEPGMITVDESPEQ